MVGFYNYNNTPSMFYAYNFSMFRQMHSFMEGYRALKILEQFKADLPTYMPKRLVSRMVCVLFVYVSKETVQSKIHPPSRVIKHCVVCNNSSPLPAY